MCWGSKLPLLSYSRDGRCCGSGLLGAPLIVAFGRVTRTEPCHGCVVVPLMIWVIYLTVWDYGPIFVPVCNILLQWWGCVVSFVNLKIEWLSKLRLPQKNTGSWGFRGDHFLGVEQSMVPAFCKHKPLKEFALHINRHDAPILQYDGRILLFNAKNCFARAATFHWRKGY